MTTTNENSVQFNPKGFRKIMDFALCAASHDVTRFQLNGLLFSENRIVAADGHRLHFQDLPVTLPIGSYLVPRVICEAAREFAKNASYIVKVTLNAKTARFTFDEDISIEEKYIEAEFPRYQQAVPSNDSLEKGFTSNRRALVKQLELAYKNAPESGRVKLVIEPEGGFVILLSRNEGDKEEKSFRVEKASLVAAKKFSISFNGHYWLESLKAMTCDEVTVRGADSLDPVVITGAEKTSVIMPMAR